MERYLHSCKNTRKHGSHRAITKIIASLILVSMDKLMFNLKEETMGIFK